MKARSWIASSVLAATALAGCGEPPAQGGSEGSGSSDVVGNPQYDVLIDEIEKFSDGVGPVALDRVAEILGENGFPVSWFQEHQFLWVADMREIFDSEVRDGSTPGEFALCIEGDCYQVVLFGDSPRLAIDGAVIEDLIVTAAGVEAYGWCSGEEAVVFGNASTVDQLTPVGRTAIETQNTLRLTFRIELDLAQRPTDVSDGWSITCGD